MILETILDFNGRIISVKRLPYKSKAELYEYLEGRIGIGTWMKVYGTIFKDPDDLQVRTYALYENGSVYLAFFQDKDSVVENTTFTIKTKLDLAQGRPVRYKIQTDEEQEMVTLAGQKIRYR